MSTANRLIHEKSPYLQQHAHNPVDWRPWGEEAFAAARAQDKPLFVSIGYATCHWCHVMERESFEDAATAAAMNEAFINVKVDREERPDIDTVYMTACQLMNGHGGWPLNVLLTPEGQPFFSATYLPPDSGFGRLGLKDLCQRVNELWATSRKDLLDSAASVTHTLRLACREDGEDTGAPAGDITPHADPRIMERGFKELEERFDAVHGGFGNAPKFPTPHVLLFLLSLKDTQHGPKALEMASKTLTAMRLGGIFDHVGWGFHRYATDASWLLPHFEKMLYDQAMLAYTYATAYQATGRDAFATTAREVLTYVMRDLLSPEGAFFSAEDADSEGEEGKFYVFSLEEVQSALGEDAELATEVLNCAPGGNFAEEATGKPTGTNILHLSEPLADVAARLEQDPEKLAQRLEAARKTLFSLRERRVRPLLDDKILTDWNGLMLAALAKGSTLPGGERWLRDSRRTAEWLLLHLRTDPVPETNGVRLLLHRYRDGEAGLPAHVNDYAFLCWGLIELYQAGGGDEWLKEAVALCDAMLALFWDEARGGLFMTSPIAGEQLICRPKELYDGALPSGNSVAALVLERLGKLASRQDLSERAKALRKDASFSVKNQPAAHAFMLWAASEADK